MARLMRCIAAAGLRVSYVRLLEPTDSVQVKAAKLLDVLEKAGLKGDLPGTRGKRSGGNYGAWNASPIGVFSVPPRPYAKSGPEVVTKAGVPHRPTS